MNLIAIAWGYVALMMALAEATSTQGSVLGALITFLLYGALPISILVYVMRSPARRAARKRQQMAEQTEQTEQEPARQQDLEVPSEQPDHGHHAPGLRLPAEGEKP